MRSTILRQAVVDGERRTAYQGLRTWVTSARRQKSRDDFTIPAASVAIRHTSIASAEEPGSKSLIHCIPGGKRSNKTLPFFMSFKTYFEQVFYESEMEDQKMMLILGSSVACPDTSCSIVRSNNPQPVSMKSSSFSPSTTSSRLLTHCKPMLYGPVQRCSEYSRRQQPPARRRRCRSRIR